MKKRMTRAAVLSGMLITLVVGLGGQTGPPYSGFLEDYPEMVAAPGPLGGLMWEKPGLMGTNYTALMLDQPEVFLHPDSSYKGIKSDQIKALADAYAEAVAIKLVDAYPIVDEPGPNVVRIRLALTNVYMKRKRGKLWFTPIGLVRTSLKAAAGRNISLEVATIEAEALDSVTDERLAVFMNQRGQRRDRERDLEEIDTSWGDMEEAIRDFSQFARARMDLFTSR